MRKQEITPTPYTETAYKGKADPYYRNNIAPPQQRKRHLAKGQCQERVFPRVQITGICWDGFQQGYNHVDIQKAEKSTDLDLNIKEGDLRLALNNESTSSKDAILRILIFLHFSAVGIFFTLVTLITVFNGLLVGVDAVLDFRYEFFYFLAGILISKFMFRHVIGYIGLLPTKNWHTVFNRQTGMIEISNEDNTEYVHLPFEQFNAHHRTIHNERGTAYYGFTLLHYQRDLMYQYIHGVRIEDVLVHWELIKNFMDITKPLADIPQFERYRLYDPTTAAYDKKHGRPANFWCRVDKTFTKKISKLASYRAFDFPVKKADTLSEAQKHGYKVPQEVRFPWKEKVKLSDTALTFKSNWFVRFILNPLLP